MSVLQCARTENMPNVRGSRGMPTIQEGSTVVGCRKCNCPVWLSRPGRKLLDLDKTLVPVCEVCQPAVNVRLTFDESA